MTRPSRCRFVHRVDVLLDSTEAVDATASLDPTPTVTATGVPCLVVDKGGARSSGFGRELERKHVRVLFPDPIGLRQGHRLRFTTAAKVVRVLTVDSFRDDLDLGRLWVAECQETPDPDAG